MPNPAISETVSDVARRTGQITFDGLRNVRRELRRIAVYQPPITANNSHFLLGFRGSSFIEDGERPAIPLPAHLKHIIFGHSTSPRRAQNPE